MVGAIWFQFPPSWRTDAAFRKKVKFLLLAQMFILVMSLQYWVQLQMNLMTFGSASQFYIYLLWVNTCLA